jgi:hypothetical protein
MDGARPFRAQKEPRDMRRTTAAYVVLPLRAAKGEVARLGVRRFGVGALQGLYCRATMSGEEITAIDYRSAPFRQCISGAEQREPFGDIVFGKFDRKCL